MNFSDKDISQLEKIGISQQEIINQLRLLRSGMDKVKLSSPATINNGILKWTESEIEEYTDLFDSPFENLEIVRFVPASGAASRMFKNLVKFYNEKVHNEESQYFFENFNKFPFYKRFKETFPELLNTGHETSNHLEILEKLFYDSNFQFLSSPKGLIPFHFVSNVERTAFEEHFREALTHVSENRNVKLHFTVALAHRDRIREALNKVKSDLDNPNVSLSYSLQSNSTNTIALTEDDELVRESDGNMLFRPGGHGSLIKNLNEIHSDLIFIRNIDNIIPEQKRNNHVSYDKAMAGFLLKMVLKKNEILNGLESGKDTENWINKGIDFIDSELLHSKNDACKNDTDKREYIYNNLNRPMRICGMVKNVGEPGGGPFKVLKDNNISLQIVESSQIDDQDAEQVKIMNDATHFNPVDIICATRDYKGEKYDLEKFRDVETSFIASKTFENQSIKALEWPGLWNGGMFDWITFFVEIPLESFNPVKTVNDLLREMHQSAS